MQVFNVFFKIVNRQKGQIIMYLGIFLSVALLVSSQGEETVEKTFEPSTYSFAVFDEDQSSLSKALVQYLSQGNEKVAIEDDTEIIQDEIYNRNIVCVLRIPKGFGDSLNGGGSSQKIEVTGVPGTIYKQTFETLISQYITVFRGYRMGGFSEQQALTKAVAAKEQEVAVTVEGKGSTEHSYLYYFFAYVPYILLSLCVVGIVPVLIVFQKREVKDRMQCSSYSLMRLNRELILGTIATGFLLGLLFYLCALIGAGTAVLSVKGLLFGLNTIAFLFVSLSIVFLLGQLLKKTTAISMVSNVLALGMSFLTGVFVPIEFLGEGILRFAHFLPSYWYILGVRFIDSYGASESLTELWRYMGVQMLFAMAILAVGLAYSKAKSTKY